LAQPQSWFDLFTLRKSLPIGKDGLEGEYPRPRSF